MKKYIKTILLFVICLSVSLSCFSGIGVFAATDPRLVDDADILDYKEEVVLIELLDRISEDIKCDVVIVTVESMGTKTAEAFVDDYMDFHNYGYNGGDDCVLFAVGMDEREYHFSTRGFAIDAFTDDAIEYTTECLENKLGEDEYYDAFIEFAELSEEFIAGARNGDFYKKPFSLLPSICIALVIGFIIGIVYVSILKGQLRSVRAKHNAKDYQKPGSLYIENGNDMFLYRTVSRTARPQNSSSGGGSRSHRSSSGRSHGGGGGRF